MRIMYKKYKKHTQKEQVHIRSSNLKKKYCEIEATCAIWLESGISIESFEKKSITQSLARSITILISIRSCHMDLISYMCSYSE